jgi:hypothetical protein
MKKFSYFMILWALSICYGTRAQTCSGTAIMLPNGVTTVNGVQVISSSSGSVTINSNTSQLCGGSTIGPVSLSVGQNGPWSVTLTFNQPVNDLLFVLYGADPGSSSAPIPEVFMFNSNGGAVSISSNNSCASTINGNTIFSGLGAVPPYFGSGVFKISAPNKYTTLTINGPGGNSGSSIGICSTSIFLGVNDVNVKNDAVDFYPNPAKNMATITSKEALKSYKIFDQSGRLVISSSLKGNKQEINISSLKTGNYVVSVETQKQTVNKKLIKQ